MKHLTKLFNILEITRNQPQYGFALTGGDMRLGNLAEHHYAVTMIAWQLATSVQAEGAKINIQKIFEFSLIHDLGELFGGDIGMYYARANPKAREYAKKFESENHAFIGKYFGSQEKIFRALSEEILNADSDEARIVKIADYLEVTHYKFFMGKFSRKDIILVSKKLADMASGIKDPIAKKQLIEFVGYWKKEMNSSSNFFDAIIKSLTFYGA